jgi:DNA-binding MarR family transcriptional regulator
LAEQRLPRRGLKRTFCNEATNGTLTKTNDQMNMANAPQTLKNMPTLDFVTQRPSHLLHRAGQEAEELFARSIGDLGITARQFVVLSVVADRENPSQTTVCEVSGIDRSTIADIVRRLVARGLLARRRTPHDARMYALRLTAEGMSVLEKANPIAQQVDASLLNGLLPSEREAFVALLENVAVRPDATMTDA